MTIKLSWQFRERCEGISSDWRYRLKLQIFEPLPANRLAFCLKAKLCRPDEMGAIAEAVEHLSNSPNWCGVILAFNPLIILYHPHLSPEKYESTIMHELSHVILKHPPSRLYLAPDGTFSREFDSQVEAEAAYLGSCLQIPRRGLHWAVQSKMNDETIANHFGASVQMVRWRCNAVL